MLVRAILSSRKPIYWPADKDKILNLIDFYITKDISANYLEVDNMKDLTSYHVSVLMTISSTVKRKKKRLTLTNKYTDWNKFRDELDRLIDLKVRLKTAEELNAQARNLVEVIHKAAGNSTPNPKDTLVQEIYYPLEIREMIKMRRKARRIWHQSRHPEDKNSFNGIS